MVNVRGEAIRLLTSLTEGEREALTTNLKSGYECYKNRVSPLYYKEFIDELKKLLEIA